MKRIKKLYFILLSLTIMFALVGCGIRFEPGDEDEALLAEAKEALTLVSETTEDLELPSVGLNEVEITWESSNSIVISHDGKVQRPSFEVGDVTVTLTATLSIGDLTDTKVFSVTVKKLDPVENPDYIKRNLYTGQKYEILEGVQLTIPESSPILKIGMEGTKKYLYVLRPGIEHAIRVEGIKTEFFEYEVLPQFTSFGAGSDLSLFKSGSLFDEYVKPEAATYVVGVENPYRIDLSATIATFDEALTSDSMNLDASQIEVEYSIKENGMALDFDEYAEVVGNGIDFKDSALGKTIELIVSPKYNLLELEPLTQTILVSEGVNVHSNQEMKEQFANLAVTTIHLHRNIVAELNANQFRTDGTPYNFFSLGYEEEVGVHGNVYRRYHAESIGHLIVNGNYFTVNGENLPLIVGQEEDPNQGDFVNVDKTVVEAQSGIFRFGSGNKNDTVTLKNLSILGNSNRPDASDMAKSGGYNTIKNNTSKLVLDNVNIKYSNVGIFSAGSNTDTLVEYTRIENSWAANVLLWGTGITEINHSVLLKSGSASITIVDSIEAPNTPETEEDNRNDPEVIINDTIIENYVATSSPWFVAYSLNNLTTLAQGVDYLFDVIADQTGGFVKKTIYKSKDSDPTMSEFNFAILVQNPNPVASTPGHIPSAIVSIDGVVINRGQAYHESDNIDGTSFLAIVTPYGWDINEKISVKDNDAAYVASLIEGLNSPGVINKYIEIYPKPMAQVYAIFELFDE